MNRTVAMSFLCTLFAPYRAQQGQMVELRALRPKGVKAGSHIGNQSWHTLDTQGYNELIDRAEFLSERWDMFASFLPHTDQQGDANGVNRAAWLYCGIDGEEAGTEGATALLKARVAQGEISKPCMIVASGHGLHCYWRLPEVLSFEYADTKEEYSAVLRRLGQAIGTDKPPRPHSDPTRLASLPRLPGTFNRKEAHNPIPVRLLRNVRTEALWSYDLWLRKLPAEPKVRETYTEYGPGTTQALPRFILDMLFQPMGEGSRHNSFTKIAAATRRIGYGAEALLIAGEQFCRNTGYPLREMRSTVKWAINNVTPQPRAENRRHA